ncbi:hypothetical protein [Zhengella mangrovi]|uniref:hypothetical protein n=1 Tax=Zhengella mangrovi TaxID=1982044 RepID=UPI0013FD2BBD|nr:hypothetical protein [Zhengella mangrovi]
MIIPVALSWSVLSPSGNGVSCHSPEENAKDKHSAMAVTARASSKEGRQRLTFPFGKSSLEIPVPCAAREVIFSPIFFAEKYEPNLYE